MTESIVIVSAARTPIGGLLGDFASLAAWELGAVAVKAAVERAGVPGDAIDEVLLGNCPQPPGAPDAAGGSLEAAVAPADVVVTAGEDLRGIVSAHPPGTSFLIRAGVHRRQTITPKDGMAFYGEPGTVLDGEKVTAYAFETLATAPVGVVIQGLIIQNYVPPLQRSAIQGDNGVNWTVSDNEVRYNANHGLRAGRGMQVLRNYVHHNGVDGIAGYRAHGAVIDGNDVSYNNTLQTPEDPVLADASGMKFFECSNLTIRNNRVHHNYAKGIWVDHGWPGTLIERNTVTDNRDSGIWHEVSYDAVIRYNTVERNGGTTAGAWLTNAGIQITNSPDVQVYGNTVTDNANGIGVMQASGYPNGPYGANVVQNLDVHDNVVTMRIGRTGMAQNVGDPSLYTMGNNRFRNNTYYLGTSPYYFLWNERNLDEYGWKAQGQDVDGTFYRGVAAPAAPGNPRVVR